MHCHLGILFCTAIYHSLVNKPSISIRKDNWGDIFCDNSVSHRFIRKKNFFNCNMTCSIRTIFFICIKLRLFYISGYVYWNIVLIVTDLISRIILNPYWKRKPPIISKAVKNSNIRVNARLSIFLSTQHFVDSCFAFRRSPCLKLVKCGAIPFVNANNDTMNHAQYRPTLEF